MKRQVVVYGCAVWLALCLQVGLSPWSSQAYGQWRYPNKVLETVKKKKNKRNKETPKPKVSKGTEVYELSVPPPMLIQKPGSHGKKKLKKNKNLYRSELNDPRLLPLKLEKKEKQKKIFSGRQKIKVFERVKPGTHHKDRGLGPSLRYMEQGTRHQGQLKVNKSAIAEPGKGQEHSRRELRRHSREQGTSSEGKLKVQRRQVKEPGIHHEDRPQRWSKRYSNSTEAASFGGNRKVKKREILQPGTHHSERTSAVSKKYSSTEAASHPGSIKVKKREILQPGTHHSERKESIGKKYSSYEGGRFAGHQKVKKKEILKPGTHHSERNKVISRQYNSTEAAHHAGDLRVKKKYLKKPGTHHSERSKRISEQYESTAAANHSGSLRVKKKYLKKPGTHHSDRKASLARQYNSTEAASFRGNLKARSRRAKARYYEKQAEKVHQFEGNIRIKTSQRNMHPSAAARKNVGMRSRKQAEQRRQLHRWWNKLWDRGQPEVVKEKAPKPRYDKGENEIWENSRDW